MSRERSRADAAALLDLALSDGAAARAGADSILAESSDPWWASVAHHALGVVHRDAGETDRGLVEIRLALRLARRSGDLDREADVRATLGVTLVVGGRTKEGLRELARAAEDALEPGSRAKVWTRRGMVLGWVLGRHAEAAVDLRRALDVMAVDPDPVWEARTRNVLGVLLLAVGDVAAAKREVDAARVIFLAEGHEAEATYTLHNQGLVAYANGDLPTALALYDRADAQYAALAEDATTLAMDRSTALLAAGLAAEAVHVVERSLQRSTALPAQEAELELRLAEALLAADEPGRAADHARTALSSFRRAGRDWWAAHAELAVLRARFAAGTADRRAPEAAERVALALDRQRSDEAAIAWLLAGRLAARVSSEDASRAWSSAAAYRDRRGPLVRATGWLAHGLARDAEGDRRGVLAACGRGFAELDRHRATLGSSELRALAGRHGSDLADLALRTSAAGSPRRALAWSERWRATALSQPPARPGEEAVAGPLAALRDNARRLRLARENGEEVAQLEADRRRLEGSLRSRLHQTAGAKEGPEQHFAVEHLVTEVARGSFVELVEVSGTLHALVVSGGRVRRHEVGPVEAAEQAAAAAAFAMRQAARGRPAKVAEAGARLERALLGPAGRRLPGPVVVSPTSRLHGVPWGLLPSLADVPHSVVPSAALWLRARQGSAASESRVFVTGPGLTTGGAEVAVVAPRHPSAVVLRDESATVEGAMSALDGAGLAHIAAHGHFRVDSPLFSSLDLADGPLAVHDFERLDRAPHRVVLSACDSGVLAPVGAGELLGLVSALLAIGTVGVVASVAVVNDEATVDVMVEVHTALDDGADLANALHRARSAASGDPTRAATAAAFLALGV